MILATSFTLSGSPVRIATALPPHEVLVRCTSGTDVKIGGSASDCLYPVKTTDTEGTEVCLTSQGEELWADGTGTVITFEAGLDRTPSV